MYEKKPQTLEESANWISYNLKRIADQLEQMNGVVKPSHNSNPHGAGNQGQRQRSNQQIDPNNVPF